VFSTWELVQDRIDLDAQNRFGSPYPGGAPMSLADGSVRLINYSIDKSTYLSLLTPNGGEPGAQP
jgi:hypothetical protein